MAVDERYEERPRKTVVHMNLAQYLARPYAGHRVLMVDVDTPEPDTHRPTDEVGQK